MNKFEETNVNKRKTCFPSVFVFSVVDCRQLIWTKPKKEKKEKIKRNGKDPNLNRLVHVFLVIHIC